jgi:hypothetical protein
MKLWLSALAVVLSLGLTAGVVRLASGQASPKGEGDDFSAKPPSPEEMQKQYAQYMEMMKPGKLHGWLKQLLGEWNTTTRMTMGPGLPPQESKGTSRFSWAVEGKWLRQEVEGQVMGVPMKGFGVLGYDNFKKRFVGSWFDSFGTALLTFEGSLDQSGKELSLWGSMDEPLTGEHDKAVRYTYRIAGEEKVVFEIHDLAIGGEKTKVIEVEFVRKK